MAMGTGGRGAVSDINVTPLVDVMLVLLIIFMVTAPLISQGVDVNLPKTKADPLPNDSDKKLVLTIDRNRKIYFGSNADNPIAFEALPEKLKNNSRVQQDKELYLHADEKLEYGFVVKIMAIAKAAGVEHLGMVTDPLSPAEGAAAGGGAH